MEKYSMGIKKINEEIAELAMPHKIMLMNSVSIS
jgi:hypothetical protein